jgi:hypothetical protein
MSDANPSLTFGRTIATGTLLPDAVAEVDDAWVMR